MTIPTPRDHARATDSAPGGDLAALIAQAIEDPGSVVGARDGAHYIRPLVEWQTRAVLAVLAAPASEGESAGHPETTCIDCGQLVATVLATHESSKGPWHCGGSQAPAPPPPVELAASPRPAAAEGEPRLALTPEQVEEIASAIETGPPTAPPWVDRAITAGEHIRYILASALAATASTATPREQGTAEAATEGEEPWACGMPCGTFRDGGTAFCGRRRGHRTALSGGYGWHWPDGVADEWVHGPPPVPIDGPVTPREQGTAEADAEAATEGGIAGRGGRRRTVDMRDPDGSEDSWSDTTEDLVESAFGLICNVDGPAQGWTQSDEWVRAADRWCARYDRVAAPTPREQPAEALQRLRDRYDPDAEDVEFARAVAATPREQGTAEGEGGPS